MPALGARLTGLAGARNGCRERLIHDAPDSAGASPALGAASQAMIDLAAGPRHGLITRERRAHIVVGEHVA